MNEREKLENEIEIHNLFNQLFNSLNIDPSLIKPNYLQLLKNELCSNFKVTKYDEAALVNLLQDKAAKISEFNKDTINKFQNLYLKLTNRRTLTKRWETLYLLNSLSITPNLYKDLDFSETNDLQKKLININCLISGNSTMDNEQKFLNEQNNDNNELDPATNNNKENEYPLVVDKNKTDEKITEKDLVTDLLFVFTGIDGKYIYYNFEKESYVLKENIPWNEDILDIVEKLCELGWLYKNIQVYLNFFKRININSLYIQSFEYAVEKELENYYKEVSFYKKINNNDLSSYGNLEINNIIKNPQKLNFKNLILWSFKTEEKLKWLLTCCEAVHPLKGSPVLSQIYSYANFMNCDEYLKNILNEVSKPFIIFIISWIKYGEFQDPYKEFFIEIKENINNDDIWKSKYELKSRNVPNFMKRDDINKIFEIGKCINFLRNYCNIKYNLSNLQKIISYILKKYSKKENNSDNINEDIDMISTSEENSDSNENNLEKFDKEFNYGIDKDEIIFELKSYELCLDFIKFIFNPKNQEEVLNFSFIREILSNISIIHKLINKELVRIIFQKFKFIPNIQSINKYLLLGQGDMIQVLMESLYEELKKPASSIFKHTLQSCLESAINTTNAYYNDKDCLNKLNIKLLNQTTGDIGWDIFCLDYKIDYPLNIIISNKSLIDYQKLFFFLWKIKRLEYSQKHQVWRKFMTYSQISGKNFDIFRKNIQRSMQFNQEIIHFITCLHNYLTLEVLETQYKKLMKELKSINNLGELINSHNEFIENIKKKCFLDENSIFIHRKLIIIFEIILRFRTAHDVLTNTLLDVQFLQDEDFEENEESLQKQYIQESIKQISALYDNFKTEIIDLINIIKNFGGNPNLKYLAMKLDFNYYYSFIEKEKEDQEHQLIIEKLEKEELDKINRKKKEKENLYKNIKPPTNYNNNINNIQNQNFEEQEFEDENMEQQNENNESNNNMMESNLRKEDLRDNDKIEFTYKYSRPAGKNYNNYADNYNYTETYNNYRNNNLNNNYNDNSGEYINTQPNYQINNSNDDINNIDFNEGNNDNNFDDQEINMNINPNIYITSSKYKPKHDNK